MSVKSLLIILILAACLTGCAAPNATPLPANTPTPSDPSALAVQAAVEALAYNLSISEDAISVEKVEAVEWPDSCLGAGTGSMGCATVITPGYKILLTANNKTYEYHTNLDGSSVMLAGSN